MVYILDTNILIELHQHYFPEVFPSLWKKIEFKINENEIISLKETQKELKESSPARKIWDQIHYNTNKHLFQELNPKAMKELEKICNLNIYTEKFKTNKGYTTLEKEWSEYNTFIADPLLICHGLHYNSTIVTMEKENKGHNIPHVCHELKIKCIDLKKFLIENEFKF